MAQKAIELFNEILNPDEIVIALLFNVCAQLRNNDGLNVIKKSVITNANIILFR